jgi:hypothetical protein
MSPCEPSGGERRAAWEKAQLAAAAATSGTTVAFPDAAAVKAALDVHDGSGKCYFFNPFNVETADHELAVLLLPQARVGVQGEARRHLQGPAVRPGLHHGRWRRVRRATEPPRPRCKASDGHETRAKRS